MEPNPKINRKSRNTSDGCPRAWTYYKVRLPGLLTGVPEAERLKL